MEWLADPVWGGISGIVALIAILTPLFFKLISYKRKKNTQKKESEDIATRDDVNNVVERFIHVFKSHGLERTQIPRFLTNEYEITLKDISTDTNIIKVIHGNLLKGICNRFGVRPEWLDGAEDTIYPIRCFDKQPLEFIDFLSDLQDKFQNVEGFFLKDVNDELQKGDDRHPIATVFRVPITKPFEFGEDPIYRYYPLFDYYFWGYKRARLQLKAYTLIAWQFNIHIFGCNLEKNLIERIIEGLEFPGPHIQKAFKTAWYPDEYIFTNQESLASKDPEEALKAREYLSHTKWIEKIEELAGPIESKFPLKGNLKINKIL